jgi:hypothetical protein
MEVLGIQQTKKGILQAGEDYVEALKAAQIKMGIILISKARVLAPNVSGTLRNAGYVRPQRVPTKAGSLVTIGFRAKHAATMNKGSAVRKKSGKVVYRYSNGGKEFLNKALRSMKGSYASLMATMIKSFVANKVKASAISNPFPYRPAKKGPRKIGPITHAEHLKREARKARRKRS